MSNAKKSKSKSPPIPAEDAPNSSSSLKNNPFNARDGLGIYIEHPELNPEGRVVEYDDDFVVINDKYPKARSVRSLFVFCPFLACGQ
jgi:aprataxin